MARRKTYSNLNKVGQYRPAHVDGQTLYKVFQCLNPDCTEIITVKKDDIDEDYSIACPQCGYEHYSGGEQHLFDFSMDVNDDNGDAVSVQEGEFVVSHDEYIENTALYKYCLICNTLKPIECFHKHAVLKSGRQGECIMSVSYTHLCLKTLFHRQTALTKQRVPSYPTCLTTFVRR